MQAKHATKSVEELLQLKKYNMLYVNPEYQRGEVWTLPQKKLLVDSLMRGYPIPLVYLHHISRQVGAAQRDDFEIIDGQQRINALYEYREGNFKLFDPQTEAEEAQFPNFIQKQPCAWGGKRFDELPSELQKEMLATELAVEFIETGEADEARDLFIRLQAGMPLNPQEKRDAWPGNFTEYILKLAGKPQIAKYPGHDFFTVIMKARLNNRGEYRQQAAQAVILYFSRKENGRLSDTNAPAIDAFYHKNLDFDAMSSDAKRVWQILDLLTQLLGDGKRKKVRGHEMFGLVLLVDSLLDDYTKSWTTDFAKAFDKFREEVAKATANRFDDPSAEYWAKYGQLTRTNSDRSDSIQRRHSVFVDKMYAMLKPVLKDPVRGYGELEREIIYYRDGKQCQACAVGGSVHEVSWSDAEIHHVHKHSEGGKTTLENGVLVHKGCHPKGEKQENAFAEKWKSKAG
jgi:5-methylcytosine-specific restriction endonuclease McrA